MENKGNLIVVAIEAEMKRFEKEQNPPHGQALTWDQYMQDIDTLPKPTKEQTEAFIRDIYDRSNLGRIAETNFKIVVYISKREPLSDENKEENWINKFGYLSYMVLDDKNMLIHAQGSGFMGNILPEKLLSTAAIMEEVEFGGLKINVDTPIFQDDHSLEKAVSQYTA